MIPNEEQSEAIKLGTGMLGEIALWPDKRLIYKMTDSPAHSEVQKIMIKEALHMIERQSCVRFLPHTTEERFVQITVSFLVV